MDDVSVRGPIPKFYTQKELSVLLSVSERTIEDWRFRGTGPDFVKFNGLVRYPETAVWEFIDVSSARGHTADGGEQPSGSWSPRDPTVDHR